MLKNVSFETIYSNKFTLSTQAYNTKLPYLKSELRPKGLQIVVDVLLKIIIINNIVDAAFSSYTASCTMLQQGFSKLSAIGSKVLQRCPRRRCARLVPIPSVGVLRQTSREKNSYWPATLHFLNYRFMVLTAVSALPLD